MNPSQLTRRRFLTLAGAAGALATGGAFAPRARARACLPPLMDARDLATGINSFGHDLHRRLLKDAKGSTFFSPYSIETALGMTSGGAKGKTLAEMQKTLYLPDDPHPAFGELIAHLKGRMFLNQKRNPKVPGPLPDGLIPNPIKRSYELTTANAIWAMKDYPWRKEFLELTRAHYGSGVVEVDFRKSEAARAQINAWVEDETKKKIKDLIPPGVITGLTRMVLANAIYFKGTWLYQFEKKNTQDAPFLLGDGKKAEVPLMAQSGTFNYGEFDIGITRKRNPAQVIELPYAGKELSMLVFLPKEAGASDWLVEALTNKLVSGITMKPEKVNVFLPRFKAETEYSLKEPLMDLGMKAAFNDADFTGMHTSDEHLFITHVLHKAFVDVNEEGTEAAAATAVVIGRDSKSAEPEPKEFRADRPFVFAIRDNMTDCLLFLGRFAGPK
jgi:serpin B